MKRSPYLIIGNSIGALGGIEGIRSVDRERPIALVAAERDRLYARPLLPYWLAGKVADAQMSPVPPEFYDANRVAATLGAEVARIDTAARAAILADGRALEFDRALIAVGGRPIVPENLDLPRGSGAALPRGKAGVEGVSTFTTWDDARRVKAWIDAGRVHQAVVVGGGFIGVKTAEALASLGIRTTVVELADRILSAAFDATASRLAEAALGRLGIDICVGTAVEAVSQHEGHLAAATLRDGRRLECGLLLLAIGVAPNTQLAAGSGIEVRRGICVDGHLQTSVPGIYAAGDIAEALDRLSGTSRPIPILRNARRQGFVAGANMAGADEVFRGGVAMNSTTVGGLPCISVGLANPPEAEGYDILTRHDPKAGRYTKIVLRANRVVGAIFVGRIARAGVVRHLIEEEVDVAKCRGHLLDDDFPLDILPPAYWQRGWTREDGD